MKNILTSCDNVDWVFIVCVYVCVCVCVRVSSCQNVVLETPIVAGTTAEAILSALSGVCISVRPSAHGCSHGALQCLTEIKMKAELEVDPGLNRKKKVYFKSRISGGNTPTRVK